jgi:ComF family protein
MNPSAAPSVHRLPDGPPAPAAPVVTGRAGGVWPALRDFAGGLLDAFLPQTCIGCDIWIRSGGDAVCETCRAALDDLCDLPACPRCGRSMRPEAIHEDGCARCGREHFWNVAGVARIAPYIAPLSTMLRALKYASRERNADFIAGLLAMRLRQVSWTAEVEMLVPVPMHPLRRWQRPCDHAELLAQALGRRLGVPVRRAAVRRRRYAPSQTRAATRNQRFEQVRDCFAPTPQPGVAGKTVCIVDNLLMSGATIYEVSKVLRAAGAKRIYAAVAARTVMPGDFQAAAAALSDRAARR